MKALLESFSTRSVMAWYTSPVKSTFVWPTSADFLRDIISVSFLARRPNARIDGCVTLSRQMRSHQVSPQTELVVKKYMADHPEELNKPALFVMQTALLTAFGCQRK